MEQNRRALYRVKPEAKEHLELAIGDTDDRAIADEIVDITIEGVGSRFSLEGTPSLSVGDPVTMSINSPELPQPIELRATVTSRIEDRQNRHYSFHFDGESGLEKRLPKQYFHLFNRRGSYRAPHPEREPPIDVEISTSGTQSQPLTATARLDNISTTGLGAVADHEVAESLAEADSIQIALRFPESNRTLNITAWIRNRREYGDVVYYGLMFDSVRTSDYLDKEEEIVEYVLCRYREKGGGDMH